MDETANNTANAAAAPARWTETRSALCGRIEPFLLHRIDPDQQRFAARQVIPRLTWNRLDLAIKLAFIESQTSVQSDFAEALYAAHIHAFSLGEMAEPGNTEKSGLEIFTHDFRVLHSGLAAKGFDPGESLIPLASDGSLLNGAHRAACAIHLNQPVAVVETGLPPFIYDYRYFRKRGMRGDDLDAAAILYTQASRTARVALLWPAAGGSESQTEAKIGSIAYRKDIRLSPHGAHNLMSEVYSSEPWLGAAQEDFPGIQNKLVPCFAGSRPLRVFLFDADDGRDLVAMKEAIRDIHKIGKHSIHVTDTHEEAVRLARLLFNPNSIHFLENAHPNAYPETGEQLQAFADLLAAQVVDPNLAIIDSGMVMAAYGLRGAADVDFICDRDVRCDAPFEQHDGARYVQGIGDLLQDPTCHFHYRGLKFVSLDLVGGMKRVRLAGRDREDLARIAPLIDGRAKPTWRRSLLYSARFARARARHLTIRGLKAIGLFGPAKFIYERIQK